MLYFTGEISEAASGDGWAAVPGIVKIRIIK